MRKILIVDDQQSYQLLIQQVLHDIDRDLDILTAYDGREALLNIAHSLPDLVITDTYMPNMDGMELIGYLSNLMDRPKIIVLTVNQMEPDRRAGLFGSPNNKAVDFSISKDRLEFDLHTLVVDCLALHYEQ